MSTEIPFQTTLHVRDHCLCLHLQRAARRIARIFDDELRGLDLTSGQFSLMMSLNRPEPPTIGSVAELLAMDRTTLTANLKPLTRRGWVEALVDEKDKRSRRLVLTETGRAVLAQAVPIWLRVHGEIEEGLPGDADALRADLRTLSSSPEHAAAEAA
ncbi:MarR family winged helix-turn-helix transcriptional regulator [Methyloligella solikamskensis]|uniref:MarR family winged helix-turn-helix transcriptional regulator n=1 Tax=Methyloligella solikamskensis TaxID=1177756 RepID=A0ABW3JDL4_9HYPH